MTEQLFINPIMCFYAIKHEFYLKFKEIFNKYCQKCFIISKEIAKGKHKETNGEHLQIIMDMDEKTYKNFNEQIKKEFQLQGQARNGIGRQYGKISKNDIKDIEQACIYTCKDGDIDSNIDSQQIKEWYEQSYQKTKILEIKNLIEYLDSNKREFEYDSMSVIRNIKRRILKYHLEFKYRLPTKMVLETLVRCFIQDTEIYNEYQKLEMLELVYFTELYKNT